MLTLDETMKKRHPQHRRPEQTCSWGPILSPELGKWLPLCGLPLEGVGKTGKYESEALGKETLSVQIRPIHTSVLRDFKRPLALPCTTPSYTLLSLPWGSLFATLPLPTPLQGTFFRLPQCHKQL